MLFCFLVYRCSYYVLSHIDGNEGSLSFIKKCNEVYNYANRGHQRQVIVCGQYIPLAYSSTNSSYDINNILCFINKYP